MHIIHAIIALLRGADQVSKPGYKPLVGTKTLFKIIGLILALVIGAMIYNDGRKETILGAYGVLCAIVIVPLLIIKVFEGFKRSRQVPKEERTQFLKGISRENNLYAAKLLVPAGMIFAGLYFYL